MKIISIAITLFMTVIALGGCSVSVTYPDSTIKREPTREPKKVKRIPDDKIVFEYKKSPNEDLLFINTMFERTYKGRNPRRYFGGFVAKYELKLLDGYTGDVLYSHDTHRADEVIQIEVRLHDDYPECLEVHISGTAIANKTAKEIDFSTKDTVGC